MMWSLLVVLVILVVGGVSYRLIDEVLRYRDLQRRLVEEHRRRRAKARQ
jgi:hypothetical protein